VGKARLFYEFKATSQSGCMVLEALSVSHGKASAYLPVIDLLHGYFEITPDVDGRARRERVGGKVLMLDRTLEDALPYLFSLLGIADTPDPLAQMDGQVRKRRTLDAIKRVLLRESLNQPLIVIFEDLHWIDDETQALLNILADGIANAHILLMVNYRPEYHHEWSNRSHYVQLRLDPLGSQSSAEMLSELLGEALELVPIKRAIIERTEGNPFFIEELVQALFDEGVLIRNGTVKLVRSISQLRIPATAQAVLAARIDRLSPDLKQLLQTLAVIGREFPIGLIRRVARLPDVELDRMLNDLQLAEFIYEQPAFPESEFIFKHALTQEVAYNSILAERRKLIDEQAAQAIEALFAANLPDHYTDLARHYERSGNIPKAVKYLHLAGQQALSRSAYQEADARLTPALELLRTQVETAERDRTEIALVLDLAMYTGMGAIRGTETLSMLERALYLSHKIGDNFNRLRILEFLTGYYSILPDRLSRARALNNELLTIGEQQQDPELVGFARAWFGWLSMHEGDFSGALVELEQAYRISGIPSLPQRKRPMYWRVHSRAFGSFALWASGYPMRAIARATEAFEVARDLAAPAEARIIACWWSGHLHLLLRDSNTARAFSEEEATLGAQHGLPGLDYVALEAGVLVQLGQIDAALSQTLRYKTDFIERGDVFHSWLFLALVNAYLASGRTPEGIEAVDEGLELCRNSGVLMLESEMHRLKGELFLNNGNDEAAARCFSDAIDLARHQSAKSWELRATMSLARLISNQNRRDEARGMLAEIYHWFTEGFDTRDLQEAKQLLNELDQEF
jgi:tetratricopeptide (TPR) repeat protein